MITVNFNVTVDQQSKVANLVCIVCNILR